MTQNYWSQHWKARPNRRRFLAGAAAAGVGGASLALVGCGDDNKGNSTPKGGTPAGTSSPGGGSSATAAPAGSPWAKATKGGTYKTFFTGDPPTIDPYGNLSFLTKTYSAFVYSRLFRYKTGWHVAKNDRIPTADLAEKAEPNSDGTEWTVTLRPGTKFHDIAPVSGRALKMDDVKYSWERLTGPTSQNRSQVSFVDSVQYIDDKTLKFKLKTPNAAMMDILADANLLWILPTEADGGFDVTKRSIGTGPWMFENYTPSSSFTFKKNPAWFENGFPLMDGIQVSIIPAYANRKAQFIAGNIDTFDINNADLLELQKQVDKATYFGETPTALTFFYFDNKPDSPWQKDDRVRLAISMALDRVTLTDLAYNLKGLKDAGIKTESPWNNIIPAGISRWWLDPTSAEAGDSAKYFKYDPAEAKKLLSAAGYADGFEMKYQYPAAVYGAAFNAVAEANIQLLAAIGVKCNTEVQNYQSQYITHTFTGDFTGMAYGAQTPFLEGGAYLIRFFTPNPLNHGHINDQKLVDLTMKQQGQLDPKERRATFVEAQQYHASKMYYVPNAGAGTTYLGYREWMGGVEDVRTLSGSYGSGTEMYPFWWKTQA